MSIITSTNHIKKSMLTDSSYMIKSVQWHCHKSQPIAEWLGTLVENYRISPQVLLLGLQSLVWNYNRHMGLLWHELIVHSDSMSCLQAIKGENTRNLLIYRIMNLLWVLGEKDMSFLLDTIPLPH